MIGIIDYKAGNLRSVQKGFEKVGYTAEIVTEAKELIRYDKIVLPGVGSFKSGMDALTELKFDKAVIDAVKEKKPLLGICLGFQFLFDKSFEEGENKGLSLISGDVMRFEIDEKVPHMGWNDVLFDLNCPLFRNLKGSNDMYFVHSYYAKLNKYAVGSCFYGVNFTAAAQKDNVFGVQFHPEKSGDEGLKILKNFGGLK